MPFIQNKYQMRGTVMFRVRAFNKLDLDLGILHTSRQAHVDESDYVWDAIVGVRGEIKLDDKWFMPYLADIGGAVRTHLASLSWRWL